VSFDITNWFAVFVRVGAFLMVFPFTGSANVPLRLRIALTAFTAFLITPALPPAPATYGSLFSLIGLLFTEASVGLLLGFVARLVFYALEITAGILTTEMGLQLAPQFNPVNQSQVTAPGMVLHWMALMLFLGFDLHHWLFAALQETYNVLPAGAAGLSEMSMNDFVARTGRMFKFALQVAAPMLAVSFVISLIFSVLARAVPHMNVFSESFPVRTMACLIIFGLTLNLMAQHVLNELRRIPDDMIRVAEMLHGG
jgi:flagellar biosynthetic protein FliR